jgi:cobalt-precorrin 5A hydrolase
VLVFPRDREKGERIVQALGRDYSPSLIPYQKKVIEETLQRFDLLVAVMATGIVVRAICPFLKTKWHDRPVVAVDSGMRCAVPVVGGHHGANELALALSSALGLYPAITTATDSLGRPCLEETAARLGAEIVNQEASKEINLAFLAQDVPVLRLKGPQIVVVDGDVAVLKIKGLVAGLGARRGVREDEVIEALDRALQEAGKTREDISVLATAWLKKDEEGIRKAAEHLGKEVIYLSREVLNAQSPSSPSRAGDLGLTGVAEPSVLALANRVILPKRAYGRVTVALGE